MQKTKIFTVTLPLPSWLFSSLNVIDYNAKVQSAIGERKERTFNNPFKRLNLNFNYMKKINSLKNVITTPIGMGAVIIFALILIGYFVFARSAKNQSNTSSSNIAPLSQASVNRKFEIPIRNAKGLETGAKLSISLTTIDRSKRILWQAKPVGAREGKIFLILNFEIENTSNKQLTVRPIDLIRLVDNQNRNFAPDLHNNNVKVEALSIKKTRAGFIVNQDQKNFKILFGEIDGNKETIELNFN